MPGNQISSRLPESLEQLGRLVRLAQERRQGEGAERAIALPEILCQTRIERGWSQQRLAFHICVTTETISRIERGVTVPDPEVEKKLLHWLARGRKQN